MFGGVPGFFIILLGLNVFCLGIIVGVASIPKEASLTRWVHAWYDSAHHFTFSVWYEIQVNQGLAAPLFMPNPVAM